MHEESEPGGDSQKQERIVQASTLLFTLRAPHVPESEGEGLKEMDDCGTRLVVNIFLDISEVNRQAIYRTRSAGQNILQYIGCTREAQIRP